MLEEIIKRDGTVEPYMPVKLRKWVEWSAASIKDEIDWSSIVMGAVKGVGSKIESQVLQKRLIAECVQKKQWGYSLMAGKLFAALSRKEIFPEGLPTIKDQFAKLTKLGLMEPFNYTDEEYSLMESIIDHTRDYELSYAQAKQDIKKYSIQNKIAKLSYETPQFMFMRMAAKLADDEHPSVKMMHLKNWYNHFSKHQINCPTPNFKNLGTPRRGYASCCLYTTNDTAASLAAGDHIAYVMTYMSAGIGGHLGTRSKGDPVAGGSIIHQGKAPYYEAVAGATRANIQADRGGAYTGYFDLYDPEAPFLLETQNPRTPAENQNRKIHFAFMFNRLLAKKVASNGKIFQFNTKTAPDLWAALFSGDKDNFETLYEKYENNPLFPKKYVDARQLIVQAWIQRNEISTLYPAQIDEMNYHTPFKDPIHSSNLCMEIAEPTKGYKSVADLYRVDHHDGEVATCNLGGIVITNIPYDETRDEVYESAMYYALKMIDKTIDMAHYELPHVGYTARNRRNAAVGIMSLAYHMAMKGLKYDTPEGLQEIHDVSETHAYFAIKCALRLGKELGNAPWIDKTKWPDGWLPIDTYKRSVDELVPNVLKRPWEPLRAEIIANKGIRFSCLVGHMPGESSSKSSGGTNSVYLIRDLDLNKTDYSVSIDWCAPENVRLKDAYQIAYEVEPVDVIKAYAVVQKFTDHAISADIYQDRVKNPTINEDKLVEEFLAIVKYGLKTAYYNVTLTNESVDVNEQNSLFSAKPESIKETNRPIPQSQQPVDVLEALGEGGDATRGCPSGVCSL